MIVRGLDSTGDWTFGRGKNNYKFNNDAIAQNISTRLKSFLADCFFDLEAGLDWWNLLGSKNQLALNLAINAIILKTEGVSSIINLSTSLDSNRKFSISYDVTTVYSQGQVETTISVNNRYLLTEDGQVLTTESGQPITSG